MTIQDELTAAADRTRREVEAAVDTGDATSRATRARGVVRRGGGLTVG